MHQHSFECECESSKHILWSLFQSEMLRYCDKTTTNRFPWMKHCTSALLTWLVSVLQEIPVVGYDTWFKLEPRSSTSKVQGECHLILKLFTSQVCAVRQWSSIQNKHIILLCACVWRIISSHYCCCFSLRETLLCLRKTQTSLFTRNCWVRLWNMSTVMLRWVLYRYLFKAAKLSVILSY